MRIAIFGGTGFVGSYLLDALVAAGHEPAALVRSGSEEKLRHRQRCRVVNGDITDARAVGEVLTGCDAAIYNIGILREVPSAGVTFKALQYEGAKLAVESAMEHGVGRFILMSANGVKMPGTAYQETKYLAERFLAQSELRYTIFRPSVVFGDPRGRMEFCTQLRDDMILPPIPAPNFFRGSSPASGGFAMSPVHVRDVAEAFVRSLTDADTIGETYPLCGPEALAWPEIIRRIAAAVERKKAIVPVPAAMVRAAASLLDRFESFPITRDQLDMLLEGNTGDSTAVFEQLGIRPLRFDVENLAYLK